MLKLDHVIVAVSELAQAAEDYRSLGFSVIPGGTHTNGATRNALVVFKDGSYLELLASTGKIPEDGGIDFSFLVRHGEGIVGYALYADDLKREVKAIRERGISLGNIRSGGRRRADSIELRWQTTSPVMGFSPFLIQDISPRYLRVPEHLAATSHPNTVTGIAGLVMGIDNAELSNAITYYTMLTGVTPVMNHQVYGYVELSDVVIHFRQPQLQRRYPDEFGHVPEEIVLTVEAPDVNHRLFDSSQTHGVHFSLSKS